MIVTPEKVKEENCQKEINAVLAKYGFVMEPFAILKLSGMVMGINLIPKSSLKQGPKGGIVDVG